MEIDEIRNQIAEKLSNDFDVWNDVINNTSPGNYGCDYWEAEVDYNDVYVDVPRRTFNVKNGSFSADLIMGASKGDSSFDTKYAKSFTANGKFDFENSNTIKFEEINIDIDSDIFSD